MKITAAQISPDWRPVLKDISEAAAEAGSRVFAVGGFVRDVVLARPQLDLDVSVEGDAIAFADTVAARWSGRVARYPRFNTATVQSEGRPAVDFAMLRQERYPRPGALPVVKPGTIESDLFRRDFTINALAMRLETVPAYEVLDLYGGLDDLRAGRVRVLHKDSFIDDPTRMLRAARFEQRFGFRLERVTLRLLREAARDGAAGTVKPPRYFAELRRGLGEETAVKFLRRAYDLGALACLNLPAAPDWRRLQREAAAVDDVTARGERILAGLCCQQSEDMFNDVSQRFGFTRREKAACREYRRPRGGHDE